MKKFLLFAVAAVAMLATSCNNGPDNPPTPPAGITFSSSSAASYEGNGEFIFTLTGKDHSMRINLFSEVPADPNSATVAAGDYVYSATAGNQMTFIPAASATAAKGSLFDGKPIEGGTIKVTLTGNRYNMEIGITVDGETVNAKFGGLITFVNNSNEGGGDDDDDTEYTKMTHFSAVYAGDLENGSAVLELAMLKPIGNNIHAYIFFTIVDKPASGLPAMPVGTLTPASSFEKGKYLTGKPFRGTDGWSVEGTFTSILDSKGYILFDDAAAFIESGEIIIEKSGNNYVVKTKTAGRKMVDNNGTLTYGEEKSDINFKYEGAIVVELAEDDLPPSTMTESRDFGDIGGTTNNVAYLGNTPSGVTGWHVQLLGEGLSIGNNTINGNGISFLTILYTPSMAYQKDIPTGVYNIGKNLDYAVNTAESGYVDEQSYLRGTYISIRTGNKLTDYACAVPEKGTVTVTREGDITTVALEIYDKNDYKFTLTRSGKIEAANATQPSSVYSNGSLERFAPVNEIATTSKFARRINL